MDLGMGAVSKDGSGNVYLPFIDMGWVYGRESPTEISHRFLL